ENPNLNCRDATERREDYRMQTSALVASLRCYESPPRYSSLASGTVNYSAHALRKSQRVEIKQQTKRPATQAELAQQFGFMHGLDIQQRARSDHHTPSNEQGNFIGGCKKITFVTQGQRPFALEGYASEVQFVAKTDLVRRLQQPGPQLA